MVRVYELFAPITALLGLESVTITVLLYSGAVVNDRHRYIYRRIACSSDAQYPTPVQSTSPVASVAESYCIVHCGVRPLAALNTIGIFAVPADCETVAGLILPNSIIGVELPLVTYAVTEAIEILL